MAVEIIVAYEKHGDIFLDASTPEKFAQNAHALLEHRFNLGYYYYEPQPPAEYKGLSKKEIEALTDPDLKKVAARKWNNHFRAQREYEQEKAVYDEIKKEVEEGPTWVTIGSGRWERKIPTAWSLLQDRSDYEYERVALETAGDFA